MKKLELLELKKKIEESRFNYDSFKEIDYWMKKFVTGDTDEDYKYLDSAINLIGFENVLISAWFNKMYNMPQVLRSNLSSSMIEMYYSITLKESVSDYIMNGKDGKEYISKLISVYGKLSAQ